MIERVLKNASAENPMPIDINFEKIKKCIEKEETDVVYSYNDTETINAILAEMIFILGKEGKLISTSREFEKGAYAFCQTSISMFREMDVRNFQNEKPGLIEGFRQFFTESQAVMAGSSSQN
jgi:hypothetical protein